jgi:hypothetical protein
VRGRDGDYLLENWTENDADLHGERVLRIEVVLDRQSIGILESSVVARRVTIAESKDLGTRNHLSDEGVMLLGDFGDLFRAKRVFGCLQLSALSYLLRNAL